MTAMTASLPLSDAARQQLAPTGTLRVAIAVGAAISAVWCARDAAGAPRGVTVDLAHALAGRTGLPLTLVEHESSGAIMEAASSGAWDVAFAPVDAQRRTQADFGPAYFLGESTYLVRDASPIRTLADVDDPAVRVVGVEGTATLRSAHRTLARTTPHGVGGLEDALALFRSGAADAVALGRESLLSLLPDLPEARILDGHFHAAGTAVAVPLGHGAALAVVSQFLEQAKADGTVRAAFDRNGMTTAAVAPAAPAA